MRSFLQRIRYSHLVSLPSLGALAGPLKKSMFSKGCADLLIRVPPSRHDAHGLMTSHLHIHLLLLFSLLAFSACEFEGRPVELPFDPPLLLSTDITNTVTELRGPFTLPFSQTGTYPAQDAFAGFTFETPAQRIVVRVTSANDEDEPVVALYGPRNASGTWGKHRSATVGDGNTAKLVFAIDIPGRYLLLLGRSEDTSQEGGGFTLEADCGSDTCQSVQPPDCPQAVECGLACLNGFQKDERGCPMCACVDACTNELDCPPGQVCSGGRCEGECQCNLPYEPVCGGDGETYANRCEAACAGVRVLSEGECAPLCLPVTCGDTCPWGYRVDSSGCQSCECQTPCEACELTWEPVCSLNQRTFTNTCLAECQGEKVAYLGACQPQCPDLDCALDCPTGLALGADGCPECTCAENLCPVETPTEPVCSSEGITWPNLCEAQARQLTVALEKTCPGYQCIDESGCPSNMLCVKTAETCITGTTGECQGVCVREQACDASNPELWCPKGYTCIDQLCKSECRCSTIYDPVCGEDGSTYDNACIAKCLGVRVAKAGRCCPTHSACLLTAGDCPSGFAYDGNGCPLCQCRKTGQCTCGTISNPICVTASSGERITFDNGCLAGCAGFVNGIEGACE